MWSRAGWSRQDVVRSTPEGIVVETGERRFGRVGVKGVDALDYSAHPSALDRLREVWAAAHPRARTTTHPRARSG